MIKHKWTKQEINYIKSNQNKTLVEIAKDLKISKSSLTNKMFEQRIRKRYSKIFKVYMNKEELNYLAGLIDGEGSIFITKHKNKNKSYYETLLRIDNCSLQFRDYAIKNKLPFKITKRKAKGWQDKYTIEIKFTQMRGILKQVLPYLKFKKALAFLMIDYLEEKVNKKISRENGKMIKLREMIKKLNKKDKFGIYPLENKIVKKYGEKYGIKS